MQYSLCIDSINPQENLEEKLTRIKQVGFKLNKGYIPFSSEFDGGRLNQLNNSVIFSNFSEWGLFVALLNIIGAYLFSLNTVKSILS
jgi:hypothetical protein